MVYSEGMTAASTSISGFHERFDNFYSPPPSNYEDIQNLVDDFHTQNEYFQNCDTFSRTPCQSAPHSESLKTPIIRIQDEMGRTIDETDSCEVYRPTTVNIRAKESPIAEVDEERDSEVSSSLESRSEDGKEEEETIFWTKRKMLILFITSLCTLSSSFAICLFPPFFPKIAESKGASATVYGLIIGSNCFVAFIITPFIGKKLEQIGVKFAFVCGCFCSGVCCVLSGFLEFFPPGWEFVFVAVCIRSVQATANAGIMTATFALVASEFAQNIAKVFAIIRSCMNIAQMFGPILGGALYLAGSFYTPFLVIGSAQITAALLGGILLPPYRGKTQESSDKEGQEVAFRTVMKIPGVWVSFVTFVFSTMSNGFLSVTLEPLVLRKLNLSPLYVGLLFGLKDGANSITSPMWGWFCDRYKNVKIFIIISSVFACASFVLLGPMPGLPIPHDGGLPDVASTHGFVAGLWSSMSGMGRFISRGGSGILVDNIGFRNVSLIVVILHAFVGTYTLGYMMLQGLNCKCARTRLRCCPPKRDRDSKRKLRAPTAASYNTTSPTEPLTTKSVTVRIPKMRDDFEDNTFYASTSYTRKGLSSPNLH